MPDNPTMALSERDYISDGEATRAIKKALHQAFPNTKFAVTMRFGDVTWTDDGPSVEQVREALIAAGCAKVMPGYNGETWLRLGDRNLRFDRYNVAERAAAQEESARRMQEYEVQRQRQEAAVAAAAQTKREALQRPAQPHQGTVQHGDPTAFTAFEALRERAEHDVTIDGDVERQRRPSWAPPLIIEGELLDVCHELELLKPDDTPIARLWALFADPKTRGRVLREQVGELALLGIACRGFQLHPGSERGPAHTLLLEAQREESGEWRFGPAVYVSDFRSPRRSEWERLIRERERGLDNYFGPPEEVRAQAERRAKEINEQIAAIDAEDLVRAQRHYRRQELWQRAIALAQARVLEFAGAPGAQMRLASRLWSHCFNCGRTLTDPISLERGIGPECLVHKVEWIKWASSQGRDVPWIAFKSGMPEEFVVEVLHTYSQEMERPAVA